MAETKMRSKKECFKFLKHDCKTYLPEHHASVTTYFLKDLVSGNKKRKKTWRRYYILGINANEHLEIFCPQYENISVNGML